MNRYVMAGLAAAALSTGALAQQPDALQLRSWAAACANCHGTNGQAQPGMVSLAGQSRDDMTAKLIAYKEGKLPATIMHQISKGYSDEQLRALAGYFAAQKK